MRHIAFSVLLGLSAALLPAGAKAVERYASSYSVSFLGLKIASSDFTTTINGENVQIAGSLNSSGLARIFDDTAGTAAVSARLGAAGITPAAYDLRYVSGKKNKRTAISFAAGGVARTFNNPPLRKHAVYVPLAPGHLKGAFDPMTALLIKAKSPGEVCNRTVRVFDGETRADLKLSAAGAVPFSTSGFKGDAVRCRAKFVPVSGYRPDKKAIRFLRDKSRIEILFAPLGTGGLYAPVRATVGTQIGPVTVYATRFGSAN
jgi:hypothetical protein